MKKKIGVILAASAMACAMTAGVLFSGCGTKDITEFDMPEGGYDGSKVTITFANTTGQNLERIIDDAIKDFNKIYPNITVKVDNTIKSYDGLSSSIATKITSGKQPHIAFCYSDHVALYNSSNAVLALDDFLPKMDNTDVKAYKSGTGKYANSEATTANGKVKMGITEEELLNYVEPFFAEGSVYGDGHVYTLPFAKSTEVMYYNENFFEKNNLTVPETWEEMEALCQQIQGIIGKDNGKFPLGYDSDANLFITMCEQNNSPYTSAADKEHPFKFDNDKNKEFVRQLVGWVQKGYLVTQSTNDDTYTSYKFTAEEIMMSIGSTGGSSYQDPGATDGQDAFKVGVARIPQVNKDDPKSILQGPSVCIFKKDNPQEVLASWLLVKYLTTNDNFQGRYSEASGYMPVTKSAYNSDLYQDFLKEGNLTARTAATCKALVDDNAFYTSDAFVGSSKARERVELLMKNVFFGGDIDAAFRAAIRACEDYIN